MYNYKYESGGVKMEKKNGRNEAYEIIHEMIISGELPAGSVTSVSELIKKLNLGRSPIRDAILKLNDDGLVKVIPRKGIFITGIFSKDIKEMFQLRTAIELFAIDHLMEIDNKDIIKNLRTIVEKQYEAAQNNNEEIFPRLDEDFHYNIINTLDNSRILRILDESRKQMYLYGYKGITAHENALESAMEHRAILEYIEKGDKEAAKSELKSHLLKAQNFILLS